MDIQERMKRYARTQALVEELQMQLKETHAMSRRGDITDELPKGSGVGSKVETYVMQVSVIEARLDKAKERARKARDSTLKDIARVEDADAAMVLYMRYIQLWDTHTISKKMSLSLRKVYHLHTKGLRKISASYAKESRGLDLT